ncbi:glycosyltransferase [Luteolibacter algae]|uniref:Glycosyltransferase n=1 Tax=Luteolibacter algae TaxID=454151 RepID=A0ABW5D6E7_9BACT
MFLEILRIFALCLYVTASLGLIFYGLNSYILLYLYKRRARSTAERQTEQEEQWIKNVADSDLPIVTTQIPLYNELNVAGRVISAVAAFDYPQGKHQIQVLDDSNDETRELVDRLAAELRGKGIWIDVFRRQKRHGYKAGALNDAMPEAKGQFIAIFDSDFIPAPDFLRKMLPHLADQNTALVQARWTHLNREHSLLTRAQSIGIDGHFLIEQTARSANRLFLNFNGTAGVWRRTAIDDAGGWTADTLTEDLDLSYRAQLRGWHLEYVPAVTVPAELPESYTAFKSQQFRWAKGSLQTAIKLLPTVLRSKESLFTKLQSLFHLCHYFAHFLMLLVVLLAYPTFRQIGSASYHPVIVAIFSVPLILATLGPSILYISCQVLLYPKEWPRRVVILPALMLVGFGICISNTRAVFEALLGIKSGFVRTPKSGEVIKKAYRTRSNLLPMLEIGAGFYAAWSIYLLAHYGNLTILPFMSIYFFGFMMVGTSSLREQLRTA